LLVIFFIIVGDWLIIIVFLVLVIGC